MVRYTAERAFLFDFSATEAVLDQFCHETQTQSPLSCCCNSAVKWWRWWKREGEKKWWQHLSLQWGPPLGCGGPRARSSFPWFPWHCPCLGSSSGRRLIPCGTASIPCICQPAVEPAPAACQGLAIWTGTDFVLEQAPSPQSCLPRVTGTVRSPWSQHSKTEAEECWFSAEWTVPPLHSSEKFHSQPEKGPGTQCMHRPQHQHAPVDLGVRWQFSSKIFLHFRLTWLFPKELPSLKKKSWLAFAPSHCPCSGNQVPQSDYTIPTGRRVPSLAPPEGVSLGHLSRVCRRGEYNHFCKE